MSFSPSHSDQHSDEAITDEKLERTFRAIEEASERRAKEEEEEAGADPGPLDPFMSALSNAELMKKRRRQSISVSRVGSYPDVPAELVRTTSAAASPVPWAPQPLYQVNSQTGSTSSLSTTSSFASSHAHHHEEENHTTQKETIVGRRNTLSKAVSSAFSKTLTRMRSRGALNEVPDDGPVVIGVKVHEATTEMTVVTFVEEGAAQAAQAGEDGAGVDLSDTLEAGPSRRMSISVSADPPRTETGRSRSGSINRLRGKLPLRNQSSSAEAKQEDVQAGPGLGVGVSPGRDELSTSGGSPNESGKQNRRLSYFAKAIAQRLRRRKSEEDAEKDKDKEKGKEKEREKEKDKRAGKSGISEKLDKIKLKSKEKQERRETLRPTPILTLSSSIPLGTTPILKSPSVSTHPSHGSLIAAEALIPLPLSPRKVSSAAEIPLPPSPNPYTSSSISATASVSVQDPALSGANISVQTTLTEVELPLSPCLIPLPPSPVEPSKPSMIPALSIADAEGTNAESAGPTAGSSSEPVSSSRDDLDIINTHEKEEGKEEGGRLPRSALPDADFGPVGAAADVIAPVVHEPIVEVDEEVECEASLEKSLTFDSSPSEAPAPVAEKDKGTDDVARQEVEGTASKAAES